MIQLLRLACASVAPVQGLRVRLLSFCVFDTDLGSMTDKFQEIVGPMPSEDYDGVEKVFGKPKATRKRGTTPSGVPSGVEIWPACDKPPQHSSRESKGPTATRTSLRAPSSVPRKTALPAKSKYGPLTKTVDPRPRPSRLPPGSTECDVPGPVHVPTDPGIQAVANSEVRSAPLPAPVLSAPVSSVHMPPTPEPLEPEPVEPTPPEPVPPAMVVSPPSSISDPVRHERHWHADDELVVVRCQQTVFTAWNSQLVKSSELLANLLNGPMSVATFEGRRLVDISDYCEDADGFALVLDALDPLNSMFDYEGCSGKDRCRLLRAAHALGFEKIFDASVRALNTLWSSDAKEMAQTRTRMSMNEAIDTVECLLRCGSHILDGIYKRVVYEIGSAPTDVFEAHEGRLLQVFPGLRSFGLIVLREHCIKRRMKYRDAPPTEYLSICEHAPEASPVTDTQKIDKVRRWYGEMREIDKVADWSNDPLRVMQAIRSSTVVRPRGWENCPGGQCMASIRDAWDRRLDREWVDIQGLVMEHLPLE
ncbi:hypothetical protein PENSPDRAFT_203710 [Peniophora sp. CONT]|nr:hypothetical protein PENSPDRAFT_203710 [Peniophora sp. CONT]